MTDLVYDGVSPGVRHSATVEEAREAARLAEASGFDGLWISQGIAVDPIVALACVGAEAPTLKEFGTSVVPLYGRHPMGVAQLAMTAQTALGGRFTLGIGAASKQQAEERMGLAWDRPFSYTRDFGERCSRCWRARRLMWLATS